MELIKTQGCLMAMGGEDKKKDCLILKRFVQLADSVEIAPGMDLIVGCAFDTHFSQRGRHGRLLTAVAHFPQDIGFGVASLNENGKTKKK